MKKIVQIFLIFLILVVTSFSLKLLFFPKGEWVCQDGEWTKIGSPQKSKPSMACFKKEKIQKKREDEKKDKESTFTGTPFGGFDLFKNSKNGFSPAQYQESTTSSLSPASF